MIDIDGLIFAVLSSWTVLILLEKWEIREKLILKAPNKFFLKMLECDFCLVHHLVGLVFYPLFFIGQDYSIIFIPLFAATITNKLNNDNSNW